MLRTHESARRIEEIAVVLRPAAKLFGDVGHARVEVAGADGVAEAVYADECFARVYKGNTGEVIFSQYMSSCTWYENPIVADTDGDYNAELVVPSETDRVKLSLSIPAPSMDGWVRV